MIEAVKKLYQQCSIFVCLCGVPKQKSFHCKLICMFATFVKQRKIIMIINNRTAYRNWFFALSIFIVLFSSCEELPCEYSDGVLLNAGFFHLEGSNITKASIDSFSLILLNSAEGFYEEKFINEVDTLSFPLSIIDSTTTIVLKYKNNLADTLIFKHTNNLLLINHECGFETFFNIDTVITSDNLIESVWISNATVNYGSFENIKIYF